MSKSEFPSYVIAIPAWRGVGQERENLSPYQAAAPASFLTLHRLNADVNIYDFTIRIQYMLQFYLNFRFIRLHLTRSMMYGWILKYDV